MNRAQGEAPAADRSRPPIAPAAVIEEGYQAWLWLDARVEGFAASARRHIGHRTLDAVLDALAATAEAAYLPRGERRVLELEAANRRLTIVRLLLRGARERRYLSVGQHEHAMRLLESWGRQLGGWLRAERRRTATPERAHSRRWPPRARCAATRGEHTLVPPEWWTRRAQSSATR
ncbi:MAG: four helix bundle protein [Polyangiaceae bacterium]|nr:four helix bundle protein [Polyangiaceae bacterium]